MEKKQCTNFEKCSAALCPLDLNPRHYWFADAEICSRSKSLTWVKVQKKISKLNPNPHQYYTKKMLEMIIRVTPDIAGIESVGYSEIKESEWIALRKGKQSVKKANRKSMALEKLYAKTGDSGVNIDGDTLENGPKGCEPFIVKFIAVSANIDKGGFK